MENEKDISQSILANVQNIGDQLVKVDEMLDKINLDAQSKYDLQINPYWRISKSCLDIVYHVKLLDSKFHLSQDLLRDIIEKIQTFQTKHLGITRSMTGQPLKSLIVFLKTFLV